MKNKTKTFSDFFKCLQREYLVAELRYKIYERQKDKDYYLHREMEGKKKTIESISARNNFPSIFTDSWLMDKYKSEIYNDWGLPNFVYRSDEDRLNRRSHDIIAYFHKGIKVAVKTEVGVQQGQIVWSYPETNSADVSFENEIINCSFDNLQRIF